MGANLENDLKSHTTPGRITMRPYVFIPSQCLTVAWADPSSLAGLSRWAVL